MGKCRSEKRRLFGREVSFMRSIIWHGFKKSTRRDSLKFRNGVIIVSTKREDSVGIDFWVKLPYQNTLIPIQVTQRGIRHFKKHNSGSKMLDDFIKSSNQRIKAKKQLAKVSGVAFVLVRDWHSPTPSRSVAWGDMKALLYGVARLKR